ncbi:PEBP-like protein [Delitschia confertaspora ATCC 74209]|uniref:PEBP-like protein n=1 Tax=Delitschia confertaspora ATCC 74209 TaxID=1513339 RepID=A0A9P4JDX0_9PLEO|nr:PEBP-like protein [Delitschia confertaspora ATCC 74209]
MPRALPKSLSEILKTPPATPNLRISFPATGLTAVGQTVSKTDSKPTPTLHLKVPASPSKSYLSLSLDPDAPFPSFNLLSPILHSVSANLTADGDLDSDGFAQLAATNQAPLVPWLAPGPPAISAPHRYVFLVYEQPEQVTEESIRKEMGWVVGKDVGLGKRVRWNLEEFERKFGLGSVVGFGWFVCGS